MQLNLKSLIPFAIFLLVVGFLWRGLHLDPRNLPSPLINKPLPQFNLPQLGDAKHITDHDLQGQVILVNVWSSWCIACRDEHETLKTIAASKQVPIIGYDYKDTPADAKAYLKRHGNPFQRVIMDQPGSVAIDWGVYGVPETFLIGKYGHIRYKHVGVVTAQVWRDILQPKVVELQHEA